MPLNQVSENTEEFPGSGPAGDSGRQRKGMTTYDDLFGGAFKEFKAKSNGCANRGERK